MSGNQPIVFRPALLQMAAVLIWIILASAASPGPVQAKDHEVTAEYRLKAALLYKLTKFISWPAPDPSAGNDKFYICVLGENVFGDTLDPIKDRKVKQKRIEIAYFSQSDAIDQHCHLTFIEQSKAPFLRSILNRLHQVGALTISDIPGFAQQGGIVEFTRANNKVGFTINLAQARSAQLSIAAPLLQLAQVLEGSAEGAPDD